jgi:hypothetical protein
LAAGAAGAEGVVLALLLSEAGAFVSVLVSDLVSDFPFGLLSEVEELGLEA